MTIFTYQDVVRYITNFLNNKDKVHLLKCSKMLNKYEYNFLESVPIMKILTSPRYDNFTNLVVCDTFLDLYSSQMICGHNVAIKYPNRITHLTFERQQTNTIKFPLPRSLTHLKFGNYFNQPIKGCILPSVTHLTFGKYFNKSNNGNIPSSVTHLRFGIYFCKNVTDIPLSVLEIRFAGRCIYINEDIKLRVNILDN